MKKLFFLILVFPIAINFSYAQHLSFELESESVVYYSFDHCTYPYIHGKIRNLSQTETLNVDVIRIVNNMPYPWRSGICTDICYPDMVDSTQFALLPLQWQKFKFYIRYSDRTTNIAHAVIKISSKQSTQDVFINHYYGIDSCKTEKPIISEPVLLPGVYPNPFSDITTVSPGFDFTEGSFTLFNASGKIVISKTGFTGNNFKLYRGNLSNGVYQMLFSEGTRIYKSRIVIIN